MLTFDVALLKGRLARGAYLGVRLQMVGPVEYAFYVGGAVVQVVCVPMRSPLVVVLLGVVLLLLGEVRLVQGFV